MMHAGTIASRRDKELLACALDEGDALEKGTMLEVLDEDVTGMLEEVITVGEVPFSVANPQVKAAPYQGPTGLLSLLLPFSYQDLRILMA